MKFVAIIVQFVKKHYEKIILCVVLLGLAAAAIWMGEEIQNVRTGLTPPTEGPHLAKAMAPIDMTSHLMALAQVTNPPPVVLSGDHNLFNPVTWKRKANGELIKILRSGPDALVDVSNSPLYTTISYDHPTGNAGIYVFKISTHSGRASTEYPKINEKTKSGLYIVRGTKGAHPEEPDAIELEIVDTGQKVWITKSDPYKQVDGYLADLFYPPESRKLPGVHVDQPITLDNEQYKIVDITNDAVRVQSIKTTKVTTKKATGSP